jgi:capsular exopolysaccharide synthesis family protein
VKAYQSYLAEQFEDVSSQATSLISRAQGQLEKELESLESEHLDLRRRGPIHVTRGDRVSNIHEDNFAEIETKIADVRVRLADANSRLNAIRETKANGGATKEGIAALALIGEENGPRISIFTEMIRASAAQPAFLVQQPVRSEVLRAEYEQLVSLKAQERTLLEDFGSKHPDVTKTRNEIAVLEEAIEKRQAQLGTYEKTKDINADDLLVTYTKALEHDVKVMNDRLAELRTMASQEEAKAKELVNFELNEKVMSSRIDRKQQLYDAVVSRLGDLSLRGSYGSFVSDVIIPPKYGKRVWPHLAICGLVGTAGGALLGITIMLITYFTNSRFRTIGELTRGLRFPVLATLPRLEGSKLRWQWPAPKDSNKAGWSRLLELQFANKSDAAIALRGLRNALLLGRSREHSTLVLVTSPQIGDGKSVVAANLALSIAQTGRSVLLVDAQFGRPGLHELFGRQLAPGLGEVLDAEIDLLEPAVALDTHLRFIPAGTLQQSAADAFQSQRFANFCELLRERFEYVVIDGPSMFSAPEAEALASAVDQVVLVSRVSQNTRTDILLACRDIDRYGGHLAGVVANAWDASRAFARDADELARIELEPQLPKFSENGYRAETNGRHPLPANGKQAALPNS